MTNKPMLSVEREVIEGICNDFEAGRHFAVCEGAAKLRALLDKSQVEPAAQPQGEVNWNSHTPKQQWGVVAYLHRNTRNPIYGLRALWMPITVKCASDHMQNKALAEDGKEDEYHLGHETQPLYAEQPAPVVVVLTDEQILEAMRASMMDADGGYVFDTAKPDVIAAGRALLEAAKLNGLKP